ncbi:hypothetical protein NDU88_000493 [Pleurodeles waltl]|uniref:Reverse transcriptase domain-containing protein n=1 Tax=Pleurodeles waltl TaxID=8319 RepID=A0AAV7THE9_PLEWA|nr:hypothetical protein NDU88_000493 [Pleurodeles waltl]
MRPIVSTIGSAIEPLSKYVDTFLKPMVALLPSHIRDTGHFISKIEGLQYRPDGEYLVTMDLESLYTNIPQQEAIDVVALYLNRRGDDPALSFILKCLEPVLFNNYFDFNGKMYHQIKGISMGAACAPSVANLYVGAFEEKFIYNEMAPFYENVQAWSRFIDDVFFIWKGSEDQLLEFYSWLNLCDSNLRFTIKYDHHLKRRKTLLFEKLLNEAEENSAQLKYNSITGAERLCPAADLNYGKAAKQPLSRSQSRRNVRRQRVDRDGVAPAGAGRCAIPAALLAPSVLKRRCVCEHGRAGAGRMDEDDSARIQDRDKIMEEIDKTIKSILTLVSQSVFEEVKGYLDKKLSKFEEEITMKKQRKFIRDFKDYQSGRILTFHHKYDHMYTEDYKDPTPVGDVGSSGIDLGLTEESDVSDENLSDAPEITAEKNREVDTSTSRSNFLKQFLLLNQGRTERRKDFQPRGRGSGQRGRGRGIA